MSTSKHIYNYGTEDERVVILNHGSSEVQIVYDSNPQKVEQTNLQKWLQRAKDEDDL